MEAFKQKADEKVKYVSGVVTGPTLARGLIELLQAAQSLDFKQSKAVVYKMAQHDEALAAILTELMDKLHFGHLVDKLDS